MVTNVSLLRSYVKLSEHLSGIRVLTFTGLKLETRRVWCFSQTSDLSDGWQTMVFSVSLFLFQLYHPPFEGVAACIGKGLNAEIAKEAAEILEKKGCFAPLGLNDT